MPLPFSREQFLAIFASYGQEVWPLQVLAYLLGIVAIASLAVRDDRRDRVVAGVLAVMWLMTGLGYHLLFFTEINKAAYFFAALFAAQGVAFGYLAIVRSNLRFGLPGGVSGVVGFAFVAYAAVLYPAIGLWAGYPYLAVPAFGITPCPVTLFTFGVLLLTTSRGPGWLLIIPGLWSVLGGTAAFLLSVPQDWLLLFGGGIAIGILHFRKRQDSS